MVSPLHGQGMLGCIRAEQPHWAVTCTLEFIPSSLRNECGCRQLSQALAAVTSLLPCTVTVSQTWLFSSFFFRIFSIKTIGRENRTAFIVGIFKWLVDNVSKTFSFHESQSTLFLQHVLDTKLQQKIMTKSGYSNENL